MKMTETKLIPRTLLVMAMLAALGGCATEEWVRGYVGEQIKPVNGRVDAVEGTLGAQSRTMTAGLEAANKRLDGVQATLQDHDTRIAEASKTAREALDRAVAAGKLAEGKLVYETVMTDDTLKFGSGRNGLSDATKAALSQFAGDLKAKNQNVFVEIQGHTDSTGPETLNERLGLQRAEAVRRYLALAGGIPLHRMAAVSYGETTPVADNKTRQGRMANRRVVLVVLR
jgi:outer membrane protein OmpA-like peptidoglycan-associated protein